MPRVRQCHFPTLVVYNLNHLGLADADRRAAKLRTVRHLLKHHKIVGLQELHAASELEANALSSTTWMQKFSTTPLSIWLFLWILPGLTSTSRLIMLRLPIRTLFRAPSPRSAGAPLWVRVISSMYIWTLQLTHVSKSINLLGDENGLLKI